MKNVARWAIVDNNDFLEVTPKLVQILNVIPAVIDTRFSEETGSKHVPPGRKHLIGILLDV